MNFIKTKLRSWLLDNGTVCRTGNPYDNSNDAIESENQINFSIIGANGGRIVQVRYYDHATDRNQNRLHIITPDENLGEALAHIITMETLGR